VTSDPSLPSGWPGAATSLPEGWTRDVPTGDDAPALTELCRGYEAHGRGWAGATAEDLLIELSGETAVRTRRNVVIRDPAGVARGWGSAHDRAAGRMLLTAVVSAELDDATADRVAGVLFAWGDAAARSIGRGRGLATQQIDSGAFAGDARQHRWLEAAGYAKVRTWWQMVRPVTERDRALADRVRDGVRIRRVRRDDDGLPDEEDLRTVHDVLESAFEDHFNSHEETFDEFVLRLRESPGHRWDHWWVAELVDGPVGGPVDGIRVRPAGALVGTVVEGSAGSPDGSYVEYLGVLDAARGRGVATSLLSTVIADAASRGRDRVGLEVDADSPTGADGLYVAMGWTTSYVTESWHRHVPVGD